MEFKFRAVDDRPPPRPSLAVLTSFTELPRPTIPAHSFTPSGGDVCSFKPHLTPIRRQDFGADLIMRNVEKEQIREEMIMREIARRRELEAEVRQEIIFLEREMAKGRASRTLGLSLGDSFAMMRFNPRLPLPLSTHLFDDRVVPVQHSASPRPQLGDSTTGEPVVLPLDHPLEDANDESKASTEPSNDKLIMLAKPDPNTCGAKRKAVELPTLEPNELHSFGLKKKPKEEWSCALCHVSATSEQVWNDHLRGNKHKTKEARLKSQNSSAPVANKMKSCFANPELEAKVEAQMLMQNVVANVSKKEKNMAKKLRRNAVLQNQKKSTGLENIADRATTKKKERNFKFWCEMCHVGSFTSQVIKDHEKGKKHLANLIKYNTGVGAISSEADVSKPEATNIVADVNPNPEAFDKVEPNQIGEASSRSIGIPNPMVVFDPNKIDEAVSETISLKGVTIPKPGYSNPGFEPNKSNEASAKSICTPNLKVDCDPKKTDEAAMVLKGVIIPEPEDPDGGLEADKANKGS